MLRLLFICFLVFIGLGQAKLDPDMFGAQGSELLKELKDSGVIDQFEKELEKMLHEKKQPLENEEKNPVAEFIESYVEEKEIVLDSRILDHLASLPMTSEGEAKHYVHLTQVLDVIFDLAKLDDAETDAKVLDVIKRVKSLPVMKTSLKKLKEEEPEVVEEKLEEPAKNEVIDNQVINMVTDFIKNLKKKPEFILDVMLPMLVDQGFIGQETVQMAKIYGKNFVKSESFAFFIDSMAESIETFASSPNGLRMIQMIPQILNAEDKQSMMDLFRDEAEKNWHDFMSKMDNSDTIDQLVNSFAGAVVYSINFVKDLLKDDMKMAIGNTFLISQGLPAIKPKKVTESLFNLADKSIKLFTTWKFDLAPYKEETLKQLALIEKEYVSSNEFARLTEKEQKTLIARFFRENMVEPFQYLWIIRSHLFGPSSEGLKCAESLLCHLNFHMRKESQIKSEVTKVFSLMASFAWTMDDQDKSLDKWKLYQAIWNGHKPETDCSLQYTPTGKENICHVLPWQSGMMSLNFEHTEL